MREKAELYYIYETAGDFIFEIRIGEGKEEQIIGFTKIRKLTGIEVSNIVPDIKYPIIGETLCNQT